MSHVDHASSSGDRCHPSDPGEPGRTLTVQATDACLPPDSGEPGRTLVIDVTDGASAGD